LQGYRNIPPADLEALEEIILRLSQLVVDFPQIALVALEEGDCDRMLGVSRVIRIPGEAGAEFSVLVGDPW
jgi:hypothetical protein